MTRFTVVWHNDALNSVASFWISATDRAAVTIATNRIDRELAEDPLTKGEEVREGLRAIDIPPLRAFYDVNENDRRVEVQSVRLLVE